MKKLIIIFAAILLGTALKVEAASHTITNQLGQVITYEVDSGGVRVTSVTTSGGSQDTISYSPYAQLYTGTAAIDPTKYTPRHIGDMLIGTVSNNVYIAEGLSTSSWIQVK